MQIKNYILTDLVNIGMRQEIAKVGIEKSLTQVREQMEICVTLKFLGGTDR